MSTSRALLALGACTLALTSTAAAAGGAPSHAKLWSDKANTVGCGIEIHAKGHPATEILCGAQGLPKPKSPVGDPYVQISAHGRPHIVPISQLSYVTTVSVTLRPGAHWSALGVSCIVQAKSARCTNKSGHGFTIAKNHYKAF
jgi:hypothetical protein